MFKTVRFYGNSAHWRVQVEFFKILDCINGILSELCCFPPCFPSNALQKTDTHCVCERTVRGGLKGSAAVRSSETLRGKLDRMRSSDRRRNIAYGCRKGETGGFFQSADTVR